MFKFMTGWEHVSASTGYMGAESELAMIRGELEGQFASWSSMKSFVKDGNGTPVMFVGKKQPEGWEHIPMLEDVITDPKWAPILELLTASNVLGRPCAATPGIPEDRAKVLRTAYDKALNDPELLSYAKRAGRPIDYTSGEDALKRVKKMFDLSADLRQVLKEAFGIK
jgi:tripartite-type tricarboxylate transporter receptor subunit TctC